MCNNPTGAERPIPQGEPPPLSYDEVVFLIQLLDLNKFILGASAPDVFGNDIMRMDEIKDHLVKLRLAAFRREWAEEGE